MFFSGLRKKGDQNRKLFLTDYEQNTLCFSQFLSPYSIRGKLALKAQRDRGCYGKSLLKAATIRNLERHFSSSMLTNFDSRKAIEFGTELCLSKCLSNVNQ